jgi:hypothetical protein
MPGERKRRARQERIGRGRAPAAWGTANPLPPEVSPAAGRKVKTEKRDVGRLLIWARIPWAGQSRWAELVSRSSLDTPHRPLGLPGLGRTDNYTSYLGLV